MEAKLRAAALRGLQVRKAREEKKQIRLKIESERRERRKQSSPSRKLLYRENEIREIKRKTGRSKSYTDSVRKRNQHILVKRPTVRHRLRHRIQEVRLTSKPTYRAPASSSETKFRESSGRQMIEQEWKLLNEYNAHLHQEQKRKEFRKEREQKRQTRNDLQEQIRKAQERRERERAEAIEQGKKMRQDVSQFQQSERRKAKERMKRMKQLKCDREDQLRDNRRSERKRAEERLKFEQGEISRVRDEIDQEMKSKQRRKRENRADQIRTIEANRNIRKQRVAVTLKHMEEEKRMAKEYQLKMEAEQRAREKRLADLYRVKEKKLNLALYVRIPLPTLQYPHTHQYTQVQAGIEEQLKRDEARARRVREEKQRKDARDAAERLERVRRMKLELQRGLARQLRDNHKRQVQACREEREEARKIEENIRKYNEREINRARRRRERDDEYRGQLLSQVQQDSIRRLRVALPQESYMVHKRALREAIKWRNSRRVTK